jgi:hypothetical protein
MFLSFRRIIPLALATLTASLFALSAAAPALAGTVTGTLVLTGGTLSIAVADAPDLSLTLNGSDQTASDTFEIDAKDLRGSGAGWKVTVTSTTFTNLEGKTLANTAATITGVSALCDGGTCSEPVNGIGYPLTVPADEVAPTAATLFNAAVDSGMGDFTLTPTFQLSVPANAYAGNYSSTITLDIASGPN